MMNNEEKILPPVAFLIFSVRRILCLLTGVNQDIRDGNVLVVEHLCREAGIQEWHLPFYITAVCNLLMPKYWFSNERHRSSENEAEPKGRSFVTPHRFHNP